MLSVNDQILELILIIHTTDINPVKFTDLQETDSISDPRATTYERKSTLINPLTKPMV
jgi:hypothetical protein